MKEILTVEEWKEKPILTLVNEIYNNKTENAIEALHELAEDERLAITDKPMKPVLKFCTMGCPKCGNDLIQPFNYCRFCGVKLLQKS